MTKIKVHLKAKTYDELSIKMLLMNTLASREYQYNESFYAKGFFYVAYSDTFENWSKFSKLIDERIKIKSKAK